MTFTVTTLSGADTTVVRKKRQRIKNFTINTPSLTEFGRATIKSTEADYPRASYKTTGESLLWFDEGKVGKYVIIWDSTETTIRYRGVLRKSNESATPDNLCHIAGHVAGDTGLAQELQAKPLAGDIIVGYDIFLPQSFLSRFDSSIPEFYKRWDIPYTDQNQNPRPQVNIGIDQQSRDNTSAITTWDASNSFDPVGNAVSPTWVLPAGVSLEAGYTVNDNVIEVNAAPGQYLMECLIQSTSGKQKRGYRWWFVNGTGYNSFDEDYAVTDLSIKATIKGFTGSMTVLASSGNMPSARLYTGAPILITWDVYWADNDDVLEQTSESEVNRRTIRGTIESYEINYNPDGKVESVTVEFSDMLTVMGKLPLANQVYLLKTSPSEWIHAVEALMNPGHLAWMLADQHVPNAFQAGDYLPDGDLTSSSVTKANFSINANNVGASLQMAASYRPGANIGVLLDGRTYMRRNIAMEENSYRSAINNRHTWTAADIFGEVTFNRNERMKYGEVTGGGFVYSGGTTVAYRGRWGLQAQAQGVAKETMQDFIGESKTDVLQVIGDYTAWINRPTESITLNTYMDIVEPAKMEPHLLDLDEFDPMNTGLLDNRRFIPLSVTYSFDFESGAGLPPALAIEFAPVTQGRNADLIPVTPIDLTYSPPSRIRVTFDTNTYPNYLIGASNNITDSPDSGPDSQAAASWMTATEASDIGNGGDAAQGTGVYANVPGSDTLYVYVDLLTDRRIASFTVDLYATADDWNAGNGNITWLFRFLDSNYDEVVGGGVWGNVAHNETGTGAGTVGADGEWITASYTPGSPSEGIRHVLVYGQADGFTDGVSNVDVRIDNIVITLG